MIERFREIEGWKNKLCVLFCGPGWGPGKPRTGDIKDIPEVCVSGIGLVSFTHDILYQYGPLYTLHVITVYKVIFARYNFDPSVLSV